MSMCGNPELEAIRQHIDKLRASNQRRRRIRLQWELRQAEDPELREVLQQAIDGRITLSELLTAEPYQRAHGDAHAAIAEELRERLREGRMPTQEEMDDGLRLMNERFAQMETELQEAEQAEREEIQARIDRGEPVWDPKTRTWLN